MENIRVMRYAELDMGDLTIICGDNNAGKTLVTQTIYGFLNFWNTQYRIIISDEILREFKEVGCYRIKLEEWVQYAPNIISDACLEYTENLREKLNNENANFSLAVSSEEFKVDKSEQAIYVKYENEVSRVIKDTLFCSVCPRVYSLSNVPAMRTPSTYSGFYVTYNTVVDSFEDMFSSILSLLQLSRYLKHQARVGDLLIIEEPELHLHPKNQRKIARLLASLVNCGLKILITTHSDYVLREFNHLILLTGKSPHLKKIVKEKGYKDLELLTSSQVRLYTAEEGHVLLPNYKRKTKVKTLVEIPIDDAGIPRSDFDDVINEMNRITDDIVFGG